MDTDYSWILKLKKDVPSFLEKMSNETQGHLKFSLTGDLYPENANWNLGALVYGLKLMYVLNGDNRLNPEPYLKKIKSFSHQDAFFDNYLMHKQFLEFFLRSLKNRKIFQMKKDYIMAETRQSLSVLALYGKLKDIHFKPLLKPHEYVEIWDKYDWTLPWHFGSKVSHDAFFIRLQYDSGLITAEEYNLYRTTTLQFINRLQQADGAWYRGKTTLREKINGAMKIMTAMEQFDERPVNKLSEFEDLLFQEKELVSACDKFNLIYVLKNLGQAQKYYSSRVKKLSWEILESFRHHYFQEFGGFSFYKNKANSNYYGFRVNLGKFEPDIHGTLMFCWGITQASEILGFQNDLGWKHFRT